MGYQRDISCTKMALIIYNVFLSHMQCNVDSFFLFNLKMQLKFLKFYQTYEFSDFFCAFANWLFLLVFFFILSISLLNSSFVVEMLISHYHYPGLTLLRNG